MEIAITPHIKRWVDGWDRFSAAPDFVEEGPPRPISPAARLCLRPQVALPFLNKLGGLDKSSAFATATGLLWPSVPFVFLLPSRSFLRCPPHTDKPCYKTSLLVRTPPPPEGGGWVCPGLEPPKKPNTRRPGCPVSLPSAGIFLGYALIRPDFGGGSPGGGPKPGWVGGGTSPGVFKKNPAPPPRPSPPAPPRPQLLPMHHPARTPTHLATLPSLQPPRF